MKNMMLPLLPKRCLLLLVCLLGSAGAVVAEDVFSWNAQSEVFLGKEFAGTEQSASIVGKLTGLLARITGGEVNATTMQRDGGHGIVLALAGDFPELAGGLNAEDMFGRENYRLLSTPDRVYVIGATSAGVATGVADLMYRMGYRCYFPMPEWEILPTVDQLKISVDVLESPAYVSRDIFLTSFLPGDEEAYENWRFWNRQGGGFVLNTKHAYNDIYLRNQAIFDANENYFAMVKGTRQAKAGHKKFNAANPEVLALLVEDAKRQFAANPHYDSVSMDPSDFGGWDDSGEAFQTLGKATNQAVTMANAVAKEAAAPLGKYVGMYSYYEHQEAPDVELEPNLIVSFATRFLRPGRDLVESIRQWQAKGLRYFGIRDYASYWEWDQAMPGRAQGGDIHYLKESIEAYYKMGARFYTSEYAASWGPYGLGIYTATRLLWNPEADTSAIVEDFLQKSFGPAAEEMRQFYSMLNGRDSVAARQTTYSEYYQVLLKAVEKAEGHPEVLDRLRSLLAYVRYMELVTELCLARMEEKQPVLDQLYEWILRINPLHMVSTRGALLRPRGGGIRYLWQGLEHPDLDKTQSMLSALEEQPVTLDEVIPYAVDAVERSLPRMLPLLAVENQWTESPSVRNGSAFVFPMEAGGSVEVTITFRNFGFSWLPRYGIIGPDGRLWSISQMRERKDVVTINAEEAGNYILVMDASPNLVRVESWRKFYLLPSADSGTVELVSFSGTFGLDVPPYEEVQVVAGGQGRNEVTDVILSAEDGTEMVNASRINGINPVFFDLAGGDRGSRFLLTLKRPVEGYFEDQHIRLQGGEVLPLEILNSKQGNGQ